ncbi:DUF2125 domain-containing protein [Microvirga terricola]|uniref:DUF2125 domain-containing protein n=1 Tax=Microvirga terricola TaxID=2719797 RepID=A0ABX0V5U1_9HYPH|nr:DUF2125 domain-containing protein [Microvirga terricola]NIX75164.1 DUF2125 domain-containing protein [Microvirga terricola]
MDESLTEASARSNRFWLYAPITILLLVAIAWSVAWFVIRNRTSDAMDAWLAAEAKAGRQWTCEDRWMGGYPFRIEVTCDTLSLKQGAISASLGRVESIAQVYQPRLIITEIDGPLTFTDGKVTVQGSWDLLQTSVHTTQNGFQRLSIAADAPRFTISGLAENEIVTVGKHVELHIRPNPSRAEEKAYDAAVSVKQASIPFLDALVGGADPVDLSADVTASQAEGFRGRPVAEELERWRTAGGKLDILMLSMAKGPRRLEAKGALQLDELHRPAGQLSIAAAGLDGLLGNAVGGRTNGALIGALLGQGAKAAAGQPNAQPQLMPLPSLRLENGRLVLGPFVIPSIRLMPLY